MTKAVKAAIERQPLSIFVRSGMVNVKRDETQIPRGYAIIGGDGAIEYSRHIAAALGIVEAVAVHFDLTSGGYAARNHGLIVPAEMASATSRLVDEIARVVARATIWERDAAVKQIIKEAGEALRDGKESVTLALPSHLAVKLRAMTPDQIAAMVEGTNG